MLSLFDDWPRDCEEQFWQAFPRKVSKLDAMKKLRKVRERGDVPWKTLMDGVERYKIWLSQRTASVWRPEPKHPATWLNQGCWADEFGGDHHETTGSVSAAAERLAEPGFRFGPKPGGLLPAGGPGYVRLLAKD